MKDFFYLRSLLGWGIVFISGTRNCLASSHSNWGSARLSLLYVGLSILIAISWCCHSEKHFKVGFVRGHEIHITTVTSKQLHPSEND